MPHQNKNVKYRLERITKAAEELQQSSGNKCIAAQADVRNVEQLKAAVKKTIETFGRIDFVICGKPNIKLYDNNLIILI